MSDRKTGYSPLNKENNRGVTNDVMFAYVHTKINILLSVVGLFVCSFFVFCCCFFVLFCFVLFFAFCSFF